MKTLRTYFSFLFLLAISVLLVPQANGYVRAYVSSRAPMQRTDIINIAEGPDGAILFTMNKKSNKAGALLSYDLVTASFSTIATFQGELASNTTQQFAFFPNTEVVYGVCMHGGAKDRGFIYTLNTRTLEFHIEYDFANDSSLSQPSGNLVIADAHTLMGRAYNGETYQPYTYDLTTHSCQQHKVTGPGVNGIKTVPVPFGTSRCLIFQEADKNYLIDYDWKKDSIIALKELSNKLSAVGSFVVAGNGCLYCNCFYFNWNIDDFEFLKYDPELHKTFLIHCKSEFPSNVFASGMYIDQSGNLLGTTVYGGKDNAGMIYRFHPENDSMSLYHEFTDKSPGCTPVGRSIVLHSNGNIYGLSFEGGKNHDGTFWSLDPQGKETELATFVESDE